MAEKTEEKDEILEELEAQLKEVSESDDVKQYLKLTKLKTRLTEGSDKSVSSPPKPTPKKRTFF